MDPHKEKETLADIAHFLDVAHMRNEICRAEMEELTQTTLSKRHLRILFVLHTVSVGSPVPVYASSEQVHELVASVSEKKYPFGDIQAFLFDLKNRGYIHHVLHEKIDEGWEKLFTLLPKGFTLLEAYEQVHGTNYRQSNTPDTHPSITH